MTKRAGVPTNRTLKTRRDVCCKPIPLSTKAGHAGHLKKGKGGANELDLSQLHSNPAKARVLAAYTRLGTVKSACAATGTGRSTWYGWIASDPEFARDALVAADNVSDELEEEAIKRAKDGSDLLLIFLLEARRPATYRDRHAITVVSPDVQERLKRQVQAIYKVLQGHTGLVQTLLTELDEVWK